MSNSPEQLTAHIIVGDINGLLKDPTEVKWKTAEGKDQNKAEDSFGHLPPL